MNIFMLTTNGHHWHAVKYKGRILVIGYIGPVGQCLRA